MGMPGCGFFFWLPEGDHLFIGQGLLQDIRGSMPFAISYLAEIPGMTFAAREITA
jgi:hypothetical protein